MPRIVAVPLTFREASAFIAAHHRHHKPSVGDVFRVGLAVDGELVAVAMVGRPVARMLDDGVTAEVTRACVLDSSVARHAASALYARCWRVARELGFRRLLTYTMQDETGVSLVAAGWRVVHQTAGGSWDRVSRRRRGGPVGAKTLWERCDVA